MTRHLLVPCLLTALHAPAFAAPAFEFRDGDRVALVGDAFIEREQYEGWIELAATTQFPDRSVTFRNLGWSADTPAGASRNGLSLMQAGMEPAGEGWKQLQSQLSTYKPNVVVLGYGMASSLPGGQSPEEFQRDMVRLLDALPTATGKPVRVLLIGPPPRFPVGSDAEITAHRASLVKIDAVLKAISEKRSLPFVSLLDLPQDAANTDNGIHLTSTGYKVAARHLEKSLGWKPVAWDQGDTAVALRTHILKKNEWFFHRSRPANMAYIFGFRRGEQGKNAVEIPQFDPLVEAEDQQIARMRDLSKKVIVPEPPVLTASAVAANTEQPLPKFTVADGYEINLWAENPMLHKPTQMNFDPSGRLWVASAQDYPQVEVGQTANDKIIVLEDTDGDGKADRSKVFAEGLLMPTAVIPGDGGCYVAQNTDLLHFTDTNGDGVADERRRVLSGFGTEDTHHVLHTLRRGPDGKLWMDQSIYTRSGIETPHGIVRMTSGTIMRFDPQSNALKPVFFGWCNPWGHQFDHYGQSFVTDGAGGGGLNWAVPGAMYFSYANAPKELASISPGSYPKFCGLEIIDSTHFPSDWQGSMITCDFRAHRVVRFGVNELGSGYAAQELGDVVRSSEVSFRPIDVKLGPDGALYIADWSNPIINHGEVDFRDPRRDREHGRIWRVTKKGSPLVPRQDIAKLGDAPLLKLLTSPNRYEREQATMVLHESKSPTLDAAIKAYGDGANDDATKLAALWLGESRDQPDFELMEKSYATTAGPTRAAAIRLLTDWAPKMGKPRAMALLKKAVVDEHPRVRIEAVRVLASLYGTEGLDLAFQALDHPMDRFLDYALWLGVQDHGRDWFEALTSGKLEVAGRDKGLDFVLANLPASETAGMMKRVMPKSLPKDGSGPWLDLVLRTGDATALRGVYEQVVSKGFERDAALRALRGIALAAKQRKVTIGGDFSSLKSLIEWPDEDLREAAITVAGAVSAEALLPRLIELSHGPGLTPPLAQVLIKAISNFGTESARGALLALANETSPAPIRREAALALAAKHRKSAVPLIAELSSGISDPQEAGAFWQEALTFRGLSPELAAALREKPLSAAAAGLALQHVPDVADHADLLKVLRAQAGDSQAKTYTNQDVERMAKIAAAKGDAARGERIYRRATLSCSACHSIGGAGGKVGPDLTSIGASAPMDYLVESVLPPALKVKEGYHSIIVETNDGRSLMGQLVRSSDGNLVLRDAAGTLTTISEQSIVKKTDAGSMMPGNLTSTLFEQESADLYKFLSVLGKPGDFDATKSHAPRAWAVLPAKADTEAAAIKGDHSMAWTPVITAVNGGLWTEDVSSVAKDAKELVLATKLQLSADTTVALTFSGSTPSGVWIDGQPVANGSAPLTTGVHVIVVKVAPGKEPFLMKSEAGTFLADW